MNQRSKNVRILEDTLSIFQKGCYVRENREINLKTTGEQRVRSIVLLPDQVDKISRDLHADAPPANGQADIEVKNSDSLAILQKGSEYPRMPGQERKNALVLNFANPVHPGGGVRSGSRAQEEELCRRSSLLFSLESEEAGRYYQYNSGLRGCMGSDGMILTPDVEVVKDEKNQLLPEPFIVSVLTCAAPMVSHGLGNLSESAYEELLYHRIMMMFHVAIHYGYTHFVLGAWGCGAFGNDADLVSSLFFKAMGELKIPLQNGGFGGIGDFFKKIDFAVFDHTSNQYNYKAFRRQCDCFHK